MKLKLTCIRCSTLELDGKPFIFGPENLDIKTIMSLSNDGVYLFTCDKGHKNCIVVADPKFELLFESGIYALRDGYYREAATSFSVALERFYEFLIIAILGEGPIKIPFKDYRQFWKQQLKFSERQIGAVYTLWLLLFGSPMTIFDENYIKTLNLPELKNSNPVSFRNKITHSGYVPSFAEVVDFGNAIGKYIQYLSKLLHNKNPKILINAKGSALKIENPICPEGYCCVTTSFSKFLYLGDFGFFDKQLDLLEYQSGLPNIT